MTLSFQAFDEATVLEELRLQGYKPMRVDRLERRGPEQDSWARIRFARPAFAPAPCSRPRWSTGGQGLFKESWRRGPVIHVTPITILTVSSWSMGHAELGKSGKVVGM